MQVTNWPDALTIVQAHFLRPPPNLNAVALQKFGANCGGSIISPRIRAMCPGYTAMKGFAANTSIREREDTEPKRTAHVSKFGPPNRLAASVNRPELFDSRIGYLKILALSLLREIASVENMGEGRGNDTFDLQAEVRRFERELIRSALIQTGGRQRAAARLLGTKVTTLNTKIKRYKIKVSEEPTARTDLQIVRSAE